MLVKSFLAMPKSGQTKELTEYIQSFKNCEVNLPTMGDQALVVVMENNTQSSEDLLLERIHQSSSLEHMVLISSFKDAI